MAPCDISQLVIVMATHTRLPTIQPMMPRPPAEAAPVQSAVTNTMVIPVLALAAARPLPLASRRWTRARSGRSALASRMASASVAAVPQTTIPCPSSSVGGQGQEELVFDNHNAHGRHNSIPDKASSPLLMTQDNKSYVPRSINATSIKLEDETLSNYKLYDWPESVRLLLVSVGSWTAARLKKEHAAAALWRGCRVPMAEDDGTQGVELEHSACELR
jgi:hypothetical protein